ncbi:hypothetical protein PtA15_16A181 [Puccinia triticina]|uniref:Glucanase n=1 Tax=Puccinia triticina TaxID=208348 RepID=A0ABY7D4W4_9BASI|nr:uncharacterized protein PtA15_16A181 [Puccinia triticina]WAQ92275.1 hypothetical protein PtA15_16A181 [Puccinia triticina]
MHPETCLFLLLIGMKFLPVGRTLPWALMAPGRGRPTIGQNRSSTEDPLDRRLTTRFSKALLVQRTIAKLRVSSPKTSRLGLPSWYCRAREASDVAGNLTPTTGMAPVVDADERRAPVAECVLCNVVPRAPKARRSMQLLSLLDRTLFYRHEISRKLVQAKCYGSIRVQVSLIAGTLPSGFHIRLRFPNFPGLRQLDYRCLLSGLPQLLLFILLLSPGFIEVGTKCFDDKGWTSACSGTGDECAAKCVIEGAGDYPSTYGVSATKDSVTLKFVTKNNNGVNAGSRMYLLDSSGEKYQMFKLKNKQFEFDVDVSQLHCGVNGALYFTAMEQDGGQSTHSGNKAGAKYGTGYCDAQCPQDIKWIEGKANNKGWKQGEGDVGKGSMGSCCPEMDVWEANSIAQAFTTHTCQSVKPTACTGDQCGGTAANRYNGLCDKDGCDFASYRWGATEFYGQGKKVDTSKPFTVITQFVTSDKTDNGELTEIHRIYKQGNNVIKNEPVKVDGLGKADLLSDKFCAANKKMTGDQNDFEKKGGMKRMGEAMSQGMVLVMSIWDDGEAKMQWLDGTYPPGKPADKYGVKRGTCDANTGVPETTRELFGNDQVIFSNIKIRPIETTSEETPAPKQKRSTFHI